MQPHIFFKKGNTSWEKMQRYKSRGRNQAIFVPSRCSKSFSTESDVVGLSKSWVSTDKTVEKQK